MVKRFVDIVVSAAVLIAASPLLAVVLIGVWLQDFRSPLYRAPRMRAKGRTFTMLKIRSMVVNADKNGVNSTAGSDRRITPLGRFIRSYKIDELSQMWNVLKGDMSLVGPRPQVKADADLYTDEENVLLTVRPGITDLASIVFADEGEILRGSDDPDARYNQIIRPWKSRLGLLYLRKRTLATDFKVISLTVLGIVSRDAALLGVHDILTEWEADETLLRIASRKVPLVAFPPPGAESSALNERRTSWNPL
jgi:lipopolysaccharide/colanic/teichoic acid biosynthesis glycosyltransferase